MAANSERESQLIWCDQIGKRYGMLPSVVAALSPLDYLFCIDAMNAGIAAQAEAEALVREEAQADSNRAWKFLVNGEGSLPNATTRNVCIKTSIASDGPLTPVAVEHVKRVAQEQANKEIQAFADGMTGEQPRAEPKGENTNGNQ